MPYSSIDDAPANIRELDGCSLTLSQINEIMSAYDSIKESGDVNNPMAVAIAQWKKGHQIEGDKWVSMSELEGIEIFAAGQYPQGTYTEDTLKAIAGSYDPSYHEAPSYVDHPDAAGNRSAKGAACGWIDKVYVRGQKLLADIKQVPDAFIELLKGGRLKKRSVEIYPDLNGKGPYLRALAWLGADVPQVKGLADVAFREDEPTFQTVEWVGTSRAKIRKFVDRKNNHEGVSKMAEEIKVDPKKEEDKNMAELTVQFAESQKQIKELAERLAASDKVINEMKTGQSQAVIDARKAGIASFCDQMVTAMKMTPAERAVDEPVLMQIVSIATFGEAEEKLLKAKKDYYLNKAPMQKGEFDKGRSGPPKSTIQVEKEAAVALFNERREELVPLGVKLGPHVYGALYAKGFSDDEIITVLDENERRQANIKVK